MKRLYIVRGVPGSGKSTLVHIMFRGIMDNLLNNGQTAESYEADQYFYNDEGEYVFDATQLPHAHRWCHFKVDEAMRRGVNNVFVSNTFVLQSHVEPYRELARRYGYDVQEVICMGKFKNQHGVDPQRVEALRNKFQF